MNLYTPTIPWTVTSPDGQTISTVLPTTVRTFAEFVLVDVMTGDSDPVYWAVAGATRKWGPEWASRFSLAMLTYYHTGTAFEAAEQESDHFWNYLEDVYNTTPRGSERRHFRGRNGWTALDNLKQFAPDPNTFFLKMPRTYFGVKDMCERHLSQFGPYFQLKVCDYMDRCLGLPITNYAGLGRNLPTEPGRAALMMYPNVSIEAAFNQACIDALTIPPILAAPWFDRPVGPAEIETSLCGWKTTKTKGNWFGADILDKREMMRLCKSDKAREMEAMLPPLVKRGTFVCNL